MTDSVKKQSLELTSFHLHILAMILMLGDHLWGTFIVPADFLTDFGRIAFPIFAFLSVQGYLHTGDQKRYLLRLFILAMLSEIPFNLMMYSSPFMIWHQNVIWTFLIAHLLFLLCDRIQTRFHGAAAVLFLLPVILLGYLIGTISFADYYGYGILTMFVFYFFHEEKPLHRLIQLIALAYINCVMMGGMFLSWRIGGFAFDFPQQGFALLALPLLWLYHGRQGRYSPRIRICYDLFYPLHMLVLYLILHFA